MNQFLPLSQLTLFSADNIIRKKLMSTLFGLHSKQESQDIDSFDHQVIQCDDEGK